MKFSMAVLFFIAVALFTGNVHAELYMGISGKVVEEGSNIPLANVQLVLMSQTKGSVADGKSDAQGNFVLKRVPNGHYDLLAFSEDDFIEHLKSPISITIANGKNVVGLVVKLHRGGAIKGRIVTDMGKPVYKARVIHNDISASTDMAGFFILKGVHPGSVSIGIVPPSSGIKKISIVCEAAKTVDIGSVILNMGNDSAIRGTVVDSSGTAISGAVVVAYGLDTPSGGYTISSDNGSFVIVGLDVGKRYDVNVVAYGYSQAKIANVSVPSVALNVTLPASTTLSSGLLRYKLTSSKGNKRGIVAKALNLVFPKEAFAANCRSCPSGVWSGIAVDVSSLFIPLGVYKEAGGSFTVGKMACWSSSERFDFSTFCGMAGASNVISGFGLGVSGIYCKNACCGSDILGNSNGYTWNYGVPGGAFDFSNGATCGAIGLGFGGTWPDWNVVYDQGRKIQGKFAGYRACYTDELVNVFEYWLN